MRIVTGCTGEAQSSIAGLMQVANAWDTNRLLMLRFYFVFGLLVHVNERLNLSVLDHFNGLTMILISPMA